MREAQRHLKRESETGTAPVLRLDHASIITADLDRSVGFYVETLGLVLRRIESDPIRKGRRRAMLVDGSGRDTLEVIEMSELGHSTIPGRGSIHHLGFRLPADEWRRFRSRLDERNYPYQEVAGRLFVRDADGLVLELEVDA